MSRPTRPILAASFLLLAARSAGAHSVGESYLFLNVYADRIEGRVETAIDDLDDAIGLDADADGNVTEDEFLAAATAVRAYVSSHLRLAGPESPLGLQFTGEDLMAIHIGRFARIRFVVAGQGPIPDILDIHFSLLFERNPHHRGLLIVEYDQTTGTANATEALSLIFDPERPAQRLDRRSRSRTSELLAFTREGIWHIWIGFDHILFLVCLLLPAVLKSDSRRWAPVGTFRPALLEVVKIVTIFTVAHSITLTLAALGTVEVPPALVESVIALSVFAAAANNVFPLVRHGLWAIIFVFGLFHGFGFASVLGHLVLDRTSLVPALFGFNAGVEIGQITIVCVAFPVLYLLRRWSLYVPLTLRAGSSAIAILAIVWFVERAFG